MVCNYYLFVMFEKAANLNNRLLQIIGGALWVNTVPTLSFRALIRFALPLLPETTRLLRSFLVNFLSLISSEPLSSMSMSTTISSWNITWPSLSLGLPDFTWLDVCRLLLFPSAKWASAWDFQQCGILTCLDSDEPLQPPVKLKNSKWCSVNSLTIIEYSSD